MSEQEKKENQKTIVAFAAGLLIGGLLVWVFGGSTNTKKVDEVTTDTKEQVSEDTKVTGEVQTEEKTVTEEVKPTLKTGDGKIDVADQKAGTVIKLASATYPSDEGWIGVRDYVSGQPAGLLGVARFSKEQGLVPESIILQRATVVGNTYAVVFYSESGDRVFSLADDVQVEGVFSTFVAN